jgi:hypothetical protein
LIWYPELAKVCAGSGIPSASGRLAPLRGALLALGLDLDTCVCMICEELAGTLFADPPRCKSPALARGARMCKTSLDVLSSSSRLRRQGLANVLYFMPSRSASEVDRLTGDKRRRVDVNPGTVDLNAPSGEHDGSNDESLDEVQIDET